jgi:hypothetical protein
MLEFLRSKGLKPYAVEEFLYMKFLLINYRINIIYIF